MKDTVLIVDEDVNARIIAETLLQSRGVPVQSVANGSEACDLLRCRRAAFVVLVVDLDPAMVGMNGWELLRQVNGRFGGLPLPVQPRVLALCRRSEPGVERFARRLGADAFLPKPMAPRAFIETVENLLRCRTLQRYARAGAQE